MSNDIFTSVNKHMKDIPVLTIEIKTLKVANNIKKKNIKQIIAYTLTTGILIK